MVDLNEKVSNIENRLEAEKAEALRLKEKKFKFPWGTKTSPKQAAKGYVTVIKLNENGALQFSKRLIEEQTIIMDGIPRLATPEFVWHFKKVPVILLPNWSFEPIPVITPENLYKKSVDDKSLTTGLKIMLARMKSSQLEEKKGGKKWLLWLFLALVLGVVGYAIFTGGGK